MIIKTNNLITTNIDYCLGWLTNNQYDWDITTIGIGISPIITNQTNIAYQ